MNIYKYPERKKSLSCTHFLLFMHFLLFTHFSLFLCITTLYMSANAKFCGKLELNEIYHVDQVTYGWIKQ